MTTAPTPLQYSLTSQVWLYPGLSGWHFISIPKEQGGKIREKYRHLHKGWSSLPIEIYLGKTRWNTSMFWSKDAQSYILPLKAEVRRKEEIMVNDTVKYTIKIMCG